MTSHLRYLALLLIFRAAGAGAETAPLRVPAGPRPVDGWPVILGNTMRHAPAVADVDGDGRDEVAVGIRDGRVFLLDGNGRTLPGWPREMDSWAVMSPLLDDVDGDGGFEVVAASLNGFVYQWRLDGTLVRGWPLDLSGVPASSPRIVRAGPGAERRILVTIAPGSIHLLSPDGSSHRGWPKTIEHSIHASDTHPAAAADLDGDGADEIFLLSSTDAVLHAWRSDGADYPGFPRAVGEEHGCGIALDNPSRPRLIACTTRTELFVFDAAGRPLYSSSPLDTGDWFMTSPYFISSGDSSRESDLIFAGSHSGAVFLWDRDGRLLPGWPVRLGGFIYGVRETETNRAVHGPPLAADVDGDGAREIIVGCYDHHLYCLELDGGLVPGWPETVEDAIHGAMALAQLDGAGEKEIVVGQIGETMFAFHVGSPPPARIEISSPGLGGHPSVEWPPAYFAAAAAIALLAFMLARQLGIEHARAGAPAADRRTRAAIGLALCIVAVRAVYFLADIRRYADTERRLGAAEEIVRGTLESERLAVERTADDLAAHLDSSIVAETRAPFDLLPHLERLADRSRIEYRFGGLLVTDAAGEPIVGIGLARGWTDLDDLGIGPGGSAGPILIGEAPVFVEESARGIGAGPDTLRFFFFSSLLRSVPDAVADATGFSAYIRLEDRTLAWGGAALVSAPGVRPRPGRTQPARDVAVLGAPGEPRLTIHLAMESFDRSSAGWMDFAAVFLGPLLYLFLSARGAVFERVRLEWWWIALFAAAYAAGISMLRAGAGEAGSVSLSGRSLEAILHGAGALGLAVIARNVVHSRRSRRLDVALLGSYLLVGLIPLTAIIAIMAGIFRDVQYRVVQNAVAELADRADHLAISYVGRFDFPAQLEGAGKQLFGLPPETSWLNFVMENHFLFTYDLPTSFITLWATDRDDPNRYFTGYSYRAPRKDKLYSRMPAWMGGRNQKGLFLDNGAPVIRAIRTFRTRGVEARIAGHIPFDAEVAAGIENRLRILQLLPYVRLEPAWPEPARGRNLEAGWYIPFSTDIILMARDWNTGAPRWIAYRARAYLPPGREKWPIIASFVLLLLLPLGLSVWGAYATYQRTVQPLKRLLTGIRRVEQGDMEYRLRDTGQSQIALAAQSFDKMAESLERKISELAEKKKVEEVSELKSRFISMVSHDLKTPLASIKGAAENVLEELAGPVSDRQRLYLEMILRSSDNLQRMISDILDLSRIESGHMILNVETLDVALEMEHIVRSVQPLLDGKSLEAPIAVRAKATNVSADRTRLWQIVGNLMSNAIRYSPMGGRIEISIEDSSPRDVDGRAMLGISIVDQGPGIADEDVPRLFEPFFTRSSGAPREHGAGLGLPIVKQLVELHGGVVSVKRPALGGAGFTFTLPLKKGI